MIATDRLLSADAFVEALEPDAEGSLLHSSSRVLSKVSTTEVGLWEVGVGEFDEVESDEVFLVLAGSGTLAFQDRSELRLQPGVVVRLVAGDRTRWRVTSTLRQLFLAG